MLNRLNMDIAVILSAILSVSSNFWLLEFFFESQDRQDTKG